ncbi:Desmoglein-2 Cadherin family member 5 HDGC [Collichthys lucidus]|uniref:Desmoglein-2 Cadherin family member 5 HDGC n=1 Tax=Collichthys lucidus TaxID=240159 RepID=A0A4U5UHP3_COLLU|nr:Desmoglein-2 Cadherin family member 5 HDGC [Collichthys lucidus]
MARLFGAKVSLLLLLVTLMLIAETRQESPKTLRRKKREWILPPAKLLENTDYTQKPYIAKIRSDRDTKAKVEYFLTGKGADKPPYNLFVVDHDTGFVRITDKVDREEYPSYNLTGVAKYTDGSLAEDNIPLTVTILDMNDNPPYFEMHTGNVTESSKEGTFVMQIEGKDDDQAGTINSAIAYSIISQEPEGTGHMFTIEENTGKLFVKKHTLDRETHDSYKLVVMGTDMGGAANGLTGTGTVVIKVLDINDNIPTLEKSEYDGEVDENVANVPIMRIKALDNDLEHTDNWLTVFTIAQGNEDGLFEIETDPETNEGILMLVKAVDFEEVQNLELGLLIENVAPFAEGEAVLMNVGVQIGEDVEGGLKPNVEGGAKPEAGLGPGVGVGVGVGLKPGVKPGPGTTPNAPKSYPIKIAVNNVPEGPAFKPAIKEVSVSEDPNEQPEDGVVAVYTAIDPDTGKTAEDVSYAKAYDPDNWFTIDKETAEIKLNKDPDRESPYLVNGTYIAKILAITDDMPSSTATGTIAIQVADSNDHCPTLTTTYTSLCSDKKTVYVTGFDEDAIPNAAPFTFTIIPDGTQGSWEIQPINETSVALHSQEDLWPGVYELQVKVSDAQGLSCPADEVFRVDVCTCVDTEDCNILQRATRLEDTSSELSAPAIGLLLMAMCLLLFIPFLLMFCQCGGADTIFPDQFSDLPFDAKQHLISYHTEGKGEDKEVPLHSAPITMGTQNKVEAVQTRTFNAFSSKFTEHQETSEMFSESMQQFQESQNLMEVDNAYKLSREPFKNGNGSRTFGRQKLGIQHTQDLYEDIALSDAFLNDYYSQKVECVVPVKDCLLEYDFEGEGSCAGSVGCCSLLESDNDLQFLNDLGPKFKTLAQICSPPTTTPKPSLGHKVTEAVKTTVDLVEPVVKPKTERSVETKHTNVMTKKVVSSTNISSSVGSVPSMTLPHSKVTNISHSSNVSHSATLPRQAQTLVLQQQPVYYTTTPMVQPMHYVVQPQLQSTVLVADGTHGANVPSLYVVSGPQSPSGLVINGTPGSPSGLVFPSIEGPKNLASPTSPVTPTLLLPVSPGVSLPSVPVDGWKMILNPDGNYVIIEDKSSTHKVLKMDPGSPQGTVPRGAILVKEAAPPQGVLGPAAHGSVYGILPGHALANKEGVVTVNRHLRQTWVGQPVQMGLGPVNVLEVGGGQSQMGMGHVVAVERQVSQPGIWPAGIRQVSVNQFEGIPPLQKTADSSGIQEKTINVTNTIITSETSNTHLPSKEEVMKNLFKDNAQNMYDEDKQSQDVITYTSEEQHTALDVEDSSDTVQRAFEEKEKSVKPSVINLEEDIMSLPGPRVVQTPFEQSGTVVEKPGDTMDELVPETETPTNKFTDVISQTTESNDPQENSEEETNVPQEKHVPSEEEDISMVINMSSTDNFLPVSVNTDKENEVTLTFPQGEEAIPSSNQMNIVDKKKEEHEEEVEGPDNESSEFRSEFQSNEFTEDQSRKEFDEDVSPVKTVVLDVETNQIIATCDSIQPEENMEDMTLVISNAQEEVKAEHEQLLDSEIGLNTMGDELSATPPNESSTDTVNESEERANPDQEMVLEQQVDYSEEDKKEECHEKTYIADIEAKTSTQTVKTILDNKEEGDLDDPNCISASEEMTQAQVEGSNVPTVSTLEQHLHTTEDENNQQNVMAASEVDKDQVESDGDSIRDGEKEVIIVEEGKPQQSLSTSDDEDVERQDALSTSSEMEEKFISDDNITDEENNESTVEERVSPVQQMTRFSEKNEDSGNEDASCTRSQVEDTLISDDNIRDVTKEEDIVGEEVSAVEQMTSISEEDEDSEKEDASHTLSQVEDTLISDDNIRDVTKEKDIVKEEVSAEEQMTSISEEDEDSEKEDASHTLPQVEDTLISDDTFRDGMKEEEILVEVSPLQQMTSISEEDEDSEKEDAAHTLSKVEDALISDDIVSDGENEEPFRQQKNSISDDQDEEDRREDHIEEEDIKSHQMLEEESQSLETDCLEFNRVAATSREIQEMPCEVTALSSQIDYTTQDVSERQDVVGQELAGGADMEGLDDVVTSSRSSMVATGQVSLSGATGSILTSGQVPECETTQTHYPNTDTIKTEQSESGDLTLEEGNADVIIDLEIREGDASGQVLPIDNSEIHVVHKTLSLVLEAEPGLSQAGAASFIETSEVAEEARNLVLNESVQMIGEASGVDPNTVGKTASIEVSELSHYMHGAETSEDQCTDCRTQAESKADHLRRAVFDTPTILTPYCSASYVRLNTNDVSTQQIRILLFQHFNVLCVDASARLTHSCWAVFTSVYNQSWLDAAVV